MSWYREPITCEEGSTHDLRHLVEWCRRCGVARISCWFDQRKMRGYTYGDDVREAVLGKPCSAQWAGVTAKVAAN